MLPLLVLFVLPAVPTMAPQPPPVPAQVPSGEIVGVAQTPFVGISLENVVAMALAKNTDLEVARANRRIAGERIVSASGAYDVRFEIQPSYSFQQQPVQESFLSGPNGAPIQQSSLGTSAGFAGETTGGTKYALSASASRVDNNTTVDSFNPFYQTALSLNLTQPLLRGSGIGDDARYQLEQARVNAAQSGAQAELTATNVLVQALDDYYDLIAAWRNVAIQEDAMRQAQAQSQSNQRMVAHGAAAPVDVAESDAQVYTYQNNVFSALQNVERLQNRLKQAILANPADPVWTANIVPTSLPNWDVSPDEISLDALMLSAIRHRPEIEQLHDRRQLASLQTRYDKNQAKPQIDLNLGLSEIGFAGTPNNGPNPFGGAVLPPLLPYETGKLGQAWTNALDGRFPEYTLGATIALPLRNRAAEGNLHAATEQERSLDVQQIGLLQRLESESRDAIQAYRSARARLIAATAEREAAERVSQGEQRKFANGQSTTFLVLQRQVTLANARGNELQAQTDLQEALVELDRVGGTLLSRYNVNASSLAATVKKVP